MVELLYVGMLNGVFMLIVSMWLSVLCSVIVLYVLMGIVKWYVSVCVLVSDSGMLGLGVVWEVGEDCVIISWIVL